MSDESKMDVKHEGTLPFVMDQLPEFVSKKLEVELKETPEKKLNGLKELKQLLIEDQVTENIDFEDDFLVQFLRQSKYDVQRALKKVSNFVVLGKKHPCLFKAIPDNYFVTKPSTKFVVLLPKRQADGCTTVIVRLGKWDPNEMAIDDLKGLFMMFFTQLQRDLMSQINGYVTIYDFEGTGTAHLRYATPQNLYLFYHVAMNCFPGRYKEIHVINTTPAFTMVWPIIRSLLSRKIRNRIFFHSKPEELLEHFPPSVLPVEYGGELKDYDMTYWIRRANKEQMKFTIKGQPNYY